MAGRIWSAVVATGLAMTVSGLLHLAVNWFPFQIHNAHWKFLVAGATIVGGAIAWAEK